MSNAACAPTFVIGTGRCGSTMLSYMLRDHPRVLSISEFFSQVVDAARDAFAPEPIDGRRFFAILSALGPTNNFCLRHGIVFPEWLYPYDKPAARFSARTGVPAVLLETFPLLTPDPDALFDLVRDEVTTWSAATVAAHYLRLFGWLAAHFGKPTWVERSGGALIWAGALIHMFPEARFIHIVRDGRDAALSMREHPAFRFVAVMGSLAELLGVHPLASPERGRIDRVAAELRPFLPEQFDAAKFMAYRVPVSECGAFWTQQIVNGLKTLRAVPAERLLTVRYEDLLDAPKTRLDAISRFLGAAYVDEAWSARCAATVRKPRSTWRDLAKGEASALTEACRAGFEELRCVGVNYEV